MRALFTILRIPLPITNILLQSEPDKLAQSSKIYILHQKYQRIRRYIIKLIHFYLRQTTDNRLPPFHPTIQQLPPKSTIQ